MTLYITGAVLVFGYSLQAFLRDSSTPKTDRLSWLVLIVASVFWPITLPSIVRKKLKKPAPIALKTQVS